VAVARDDVSGEAVGTTGAALSAGEELRPTGSDVALLDRIADLTRGKKRSTLAGIFGDRGGRRFAYEDASRALVTLAAFALLLAVAARRLALPDAIARLSSALGNRARAVDPPKAEPAAQRAAPTTFGALLDAKERATRSRLVPRSAPSVLAAPAEPTLEVSPPAPQGVPSAPPVSPSPAPLTAAEIIAARRAGRGRRR
jgi:hypothetical protein